MPTTPLLLDGPMIEPVVSVPTVAAAKLAAAATPEPELEPAGVRLRSYGFFGLPPTVEPLNASVVRRPAHWERFALPRITTPAARKRRVTSASFAGKFSTSA